MDMGNMSHMSMSMESSSSMSMPASMHMTMHPSTTSSMNMATSTATASSSSMDGMGSMDGMEDMMGMNSYLTTAFKNYPLLFHHLSASNKSQAFGIFVLLLVTAFVYKFLLFASWCLEVHWFKTWNREQEDLSGLSNSTGTAYSFEEDIGCTEEPLPKLPNLLGDILRPSFNGMFQDCIRMILTFASTMLIYMLMLAAMSFVLTYVFAIITGLAVAEVFFNRCKMCMLKRWEIQRLIDKTNKCPGGSSCQCGRHIPASNCNPVATDDIVTTSTSHDRNSLTNEKNDDAIYDKTVIVPTDSISTQNQKDCACETVCGCENGANARDKRIERSMLENSALQEQSGYMDVDLMPADKFK